MPGLRLVVSFADLGQGHVGTLYQAAGFYYVGNSDQSYLKIHGRIVHPRTVYDRFGPGGQSLTWLRQNVDPRAERMAQAAKLRYVYPLDKSMRKKLEGLALAYPKTRSKQHQRCARAPLGGSPMGSGPTSSTSSGSGRRGRGTAGLSRGLWVAGGGWRQGHQGLGWGRGSGALHGPKKPRTRPWRQRTSPPAPEGEREPSEDLRRAPEFR